MNSCSHIKSFVKSCGSSLLPAMLFGGGGRSGRNTRLMHSSAVDSCLILIYDHKNWISICWIIKNVKMAVFPDKCTDMYSGF